jgi:ribose 5-phosphate isomerase B
VRIGIAADHGGFTLKKILMSQLGATRHEMVDFGAYAHDPGDDFPDFVIPLAEALAAGQIERGMAICGTGVGASVCANKIAGIRAALVHDNVSTRQGVEDDHINIISLSGRTMGPSVAWELVQTFLDAEFSYDERHLRRLRKIAALELQGQSHEYRARR